MFKERKLQRYSAFTLLEMLLVLAILSILGGVTASAFGGLEKSVKTSQEALSISQDIRNLQRSSMLLEREVGESWIYGLGIDFSDYTSTGEYRFFKWCSPYSSYGPTKTRAELPDFNDENPVGLNNGYLPVTDWRETCSIDNGAIQSYLVEWERGVPAATDVKLNPELNTNVGYILFESVSGRAFFYNSLGELMNYDSSGELLPNSTNFVLGVSSGSIDKSIEVKNLSGNISVLSGGESVEQEEEEIPDGPGVPPPPSPSL
jgi:prepilin-type N-terminal cleavage/methylation domain-containing protein